MGGGNGYLLHIVDKWNNVFYTIIGTAHSSTWAEDLSSLSPNPKFAYSQDEINSIINQHNGNTSHLKCNTYPLTNVLQARQEYPELFI